MKCYCNWFHLFYFLKTCLLGNFRLYRWLAPHFYWKALSSTETFGQWHVSFEELEFIHCYSWLMTWKRWFAVKLQLILLLMATQRDRVGWVHHWIISHSPQTAFKRLKRISDFRKKKDNGRVRVKLGNSGMFSFENELRPCRETNILLKCRPTSERLEPLLLPTPMWPQSSPRAGGAAVSASLHVCGLAETTAS